MDLLPYVYVNLEGNVNTIKKSSEALLDVSKDGDLEVNSE
jgi:hypothetical protein